jgi:hypothetical protein
VLSPGSNEREQSILNKLNSWKSREIIIILTTNDEVTSSILNIFMLETFQGRVME